MVHPEGGAANFRSKSGQKAVKIVDLAPNNQEKYFLG
jgi:hypothetical protein